MRLMQFQIDDIIKTALLEDINYIDVTTDYLVDENSVSTAKYVSKDEGVLCGIDVAIFSFLTAMLNVRYLSMTVKRSRKATLSQE